MLKVEEKVRLEVAPIILVFFSVLIVLPGCFQKTGTMKKENVSSTALSKHYTKAQRKSDAGQYKIQNRIESVVSAKINDPGDEANTYPSQEVINTNVIADNHTIIDTSEYISVLKAIEVVIDTSGFQQ